MNKTKIEWCNYVWNPITGCLHGCEYCFARRAAVKMAGHPNDKIRHKYRNKFEPTFHPEEFAPDKAPSSVKKPQKVFVVDMGDLFGEWVPDEWIEKVFKACEAAPQHKYFFLTKNYLRYSDLSIEQYWDGMRWFGRSVTDGKSLEKTYVPGLKSGRDFVSLEPMYGPIENFEFSWLIVGSETHNGRPVNLPKKEWILDIRKQCKDLGIPLFEKNSLHGLMDGELIQQWQES